LKTTAEKETAEMDKRSFYDSREETKVFIRKKINEIGLLGG